jgi:eukaryotic-like serine/threonine-protein kinase
MANDLETVLHDRCLTASQMLDFLAGEFSAEQEMLVVEHLSRCPACERLAGELSDDPEARQLAAAAELRPRGEEPASLSELRLRLHVLGLLGTAVDDGQPTGGGPPATAVIELARRITPHQAPAGSGLVDRPLRERELPLPPELGRFHIIREVGAGGFGIVYLAEDRLLHRQVALKVARARVLADPQQRERFLREAEALARMQHANITPVYEAGEIDGVLFLAMAYCPGPTLADWLGNLAGPVDPTLAVRLALRLAEAAEHAHQHGVLHRDIKPANVLLDLSAEETGELPFQPRLTDFGLAKFVEETSSSTVAGTVLGTPQYMAPEQVAGQGAPIGPATDVYGLGAILYQLLTGQPPFEGRSMGDTLRRLLLDDPLEVRRLAASVPPDLSAITMKCLEKSPGKRYATAAELAADLRRFLSGQPTQARPLGRVQRLVRFVRCNRWPAALAALAMVVLVLAAGLMLRESRIARWRDESAQTAAAAREVLNQQAYLSDIARVSALVVEGDLAPALAALEGVAPKAGETDRRDLAWHYLWGLATHEPQAQGQLADAIYQVSRSPATEELAVVGREGMLEIYDPRHLTRLARQETGQVEVNGVAWSPDASLLATTGDDGTVRVWERAGLRPRGQWKVDDGLAFQVLFLDGGSKLATCGEDPLIRLWDVASGELLAALEGHSASVEAIALSSDGSLLASASSDHTAIVWDWRNKSPIHTLTGHTGRLTNVAFSPDDRLVATCSVDANVCLWDAVRGERLAIQPHIDKVQSLAFSADGSRLFVGDSKGKVCDYRLLREPETGPIRLEHETLDDAWLGHHGRVWTLVAGAEPGTFYSGGHDGMLRLWAPHTPQQRVQRVVVRGEDDPICDLAFSADGSRLFILRRTSGVSILDAVTWQPIDTPSSQRRAWQAFALLDHRGEVAAGIDGGEVVITGRQAAERRTIDPDAEPFSVSRLLYSQPAGLLVVVPHGGSEIRLHDVASGKLVRKLPAGNHRTGAFSPDGTRLAVDSEGQILIYDVAALKGKKGASLKELIRLRAHSGTILALAYSPDGTLLASTSDDRSVHVWSRNGELLWSLTHSSAVIGAAFIEDGRALVTADAQGGLKLTYTQHVQSSLDIPPPAARLQHLAVAPHRRQLAAIDGEGNLIIVGAQER